MPVTEFAFKEKYKYQNGFNSYHECAFPGTFPTSHANPYAGAKQ
jgi:homogentisate 1,2-dioxygenase